jgi:hypothetical protein
VWRTGLRAAKESRLAAEVTAAALKGRAEAMNESLPTLETISARFDAWLIQARSNIDEFSSQNVHIDELLHLAVEPALGVSIAIEVFRSACQSVRSDEVLMLLIPLLEHDWFDFMPPNVAALECELSETPPSIYFMTSRAFLLPDPSVRCVIPIELAGLVGKSVATYYQCWQLPHDAPSWDRDIRAVFVGTC